MQANRLHDKHWYLQQELPPSASEADRAADRSLAEVASHLARPEGTGDPRRAATVHRWVREAAEQFTNSPVQSYVPILVEHIVRRRMGIV